MSDNNFVGCGCAAIILLGILYFSMVFIYIKSNDAPISCMFATDTVTCVQISKNK